MMVDTACPHCHHPCCWSNTSETKYVRCAFCERTFVVSTWGIGQTLHRKPRRPRTRLPLWPWILSAAVTCLVVAIGSLVIHFQREKTEEVKVSAQNFQRLRRGMTDREIVKFLGRPTRTDKSLIPELDGQMAHRFQVEEEGFTVRSFWEDGDNFIWIDFCQGRVENFGAILDGEQIGQNVQKPLVRERAKTEE